MYNTDEACTRVKQKAEHKSLSSQLSLKTTGKDKKQFSFRLQSHGRFGEN